MIAILIWLHMNAYGLETRHEFTMPDMETCPKAASSARISNNSKGDSVTVFCATKKKEQSNVQ